MGHLTVSSYHVTYTFHSQSTLYTCLNVKEILAERRRYIWTRIHNHLVCKRTLRHLNKLNKQLSCVLSTYLYGSFDFMFLSCHVGVSE